MSADEKIPGWNVTNGNRIEAQGTFTVDKHGVCIIAGGTHYSSLEEVFAPFGGGIDNLANGTLVRLVLEPIEVQRSALIQSRLFQAVFALEHAGAEKLSEVLLEAFEGESLEDVERALAQARAWAYVDLTESSDDPLAKERRIARDNIGLLWAVTEGLSR